MIKDLKKVNDWYEDPEGASWESPQDYLYSGVLPSCGCGDPASIGKYVQEMLKKHVAILGSKNPEDVWRNNSYDDLPTMFFLSWADREGYTEHGTSIRGSWLSKKGVELLLDIEEAQRLDALEETHD